MSGTSQWPIVTLDKLTKIYGRMQTPAVDTVSLKIEHGEFMVLLGPSGCGKTTTLRMIAGLESISDGALSIDNAWSTTFPRKNGTSPWCSSRMRFIRI